MVHKIIVILISAITLFTFLSFTCFVIAQPPWDYCMFYVYGTDLIVDETHGLVSFTVVTPPPDMSNQLTVMMYTGEEIWRQLVNGDAVVVSYDNLDGARDLVSFEDQNATGNYRMWYNAPVDSVMINGEYLGEGLHIEKDVSIRTNSTVTNLSVNEAEGRISFNVSGPDGSLGYCNITIPHSVVEPPFEVEIGGLPMNFDILWNNGTHSNIYLEYQHSTHEITIIPEFPAILAMSLFMMATLPAIFFYKRKRHTRARF